MHDDEDDDDDVDNNLVGLTPSPTTFYVCVLLWTLNPILACVQMWDLRRGMCVHVCTSVLSECENVGKRNARASAAVTNS